MVTLDDIETIVIGEIEYSYYLEKNKYSTQCFIIDEDYNCIKNFHITNKSDIIKELEYDAKIKALKPTFKNIVFENHIHKDYYEETCSSLYKNNIIGFPVQRRRNMKDCFYNSKSFNYEVFECLKMCKNKDIFKIKFKSKSDEYYLYSFQVSDNFKEVIALCFVKTNFDLNNFFTDFNSNKDDDDDNLYNDKNIIFVVSTSDVEDALDALFDSNKHMLRGYQNKTVSIFHNVKKTKIRDVLKSE